MGIWVLTVPLFQLLCVSEIIHNKMLEKVSCEQLCMVIIKRFIRNCSFDLSICISNYFLATHF